MIQPEPIGLLNTGLPAIVLAALAVVLPRLLVATDTRSQWSLAIAIAASAIGLLVVGALIFAATYKLEGTKVGAAFAEDALLTARYFGRLSAMAALVWVPVLALVWFAKAQAVEKRRGEDIMRTRSS